jgi:hypothetical protein
MSSAAPWDIVKGHHHPATPELDRWKAEEQAVLVVHLRHREVTMALYHVPRRSATHFLDLFLLPLGAAHDPVEGLLAFLLVAQSPASSVTTMSVTDDESLRRRAWRPRRT